jgi:hypothetical protein
LINGRIFPIAFRAFGGFEVGLLKERIDGLLTDCGIIGAIGGGLCIRSRDRGRGRCRCGG